LDSAAVAAMIAAAFPVPAAQIGEFRDGGVVFWVDGSGQHGLVCDIQDLSMSEWGCYGSLIGSTGSFIGSGQQNTIDILVGCSTVGIAADLCANSTAQGYNDWFLPSIDAMTEIYNNANDVNFTSITNGGFSLSGDYYKSSSEYDANGIYGKNFLTGSNITGQNKSFISSDRAF